MVHYWNKTEQKGFLREILSLSLTSVPVELGINYIKKQGLEKQRSCVK